MTRDAGQEVPPSTGPLADPPAPGHAAPPPTRYCPMCGRSGTPREFDLLVHAQAMDAVLAHIALAVRAGNGLTAEGMVSEVRSVLALHHLPRPSSVPGFTVTHDPPVGQ